MSGRLDRLERSALMIIGVLAVGLFASSALGDEHPKAAVSDEKLDRLEALLEAQQKKIEDLEQRLAAAAQADTNAARVDEMKKQIREILSEQEFRESLMPSTVQAGYDKGFFIKSSDDKFKLKINAQLQFRWTHYDNRYSNRYQFPGFPHGRDRTGFDFARFRLKFSGNVYSKDLTYFAEIDMGSGNSYNAQLLYGWINYRVVDEFQIKMGIFRLASTRADIGSTSTMQFCEYPTINSVYGLVRGVGVRLWGKLLKGRGEYYFDFVNSFGAPRLTITRDEDWYRTGHDNNPAIAFRTVWALLKGEMKHPEDEESFVDPSDLAIHTSPALNVGMHYAFKDDWHDGTLRIPYPRQTLFREGGFGNTSSSGLQINQFGVDAGFKYQGFSLTGEYIVRLLDVRDADGPPYTPLFLATGERSTTAQHGAYVQAGYFLPIPGFERKLEVVGRVGGLSTLAEDREGTWEYSGGLNYYIKGHKVKLQTDVIKISEVPVASHSYSMANVNDDALIWRIQLQVAF